MEKELKNEQLIIDYLLGECDREQEVLVENRIKDDKKLHQLYCHYRDILIGVDLYHNEKFNLSDEKLKTLSKQIIKQSTPTINIARYWKYIAAAVFIIITGLGILLYQNFADSKNEEVFTEYSVPFGAKSEIILLDGTNVWLNAGSKLKYNKLYGNEKREIFLEGEGFFNVAEDEDHPFIVKTKDIYVKALGTRFNVKAYSDDNMIEATLIEGSVKIEKSKHSDIIGFDKGIILKPNECLHIEKKLIGSTSNKISKNYNITIKEIDDPVLYTSWKDDIWVIKSQTLISLARELERRYNISIAFIDEDIKMVKFTGKIMNEPVEQVLKAIELSAGVKVKINGNIVTINKPS